MTENDNFEIFDSLLADDDLINNLNKLTEHAPLENLDNYRIIPKSNLYKINNFSDAAFRVIDYNNTLFINFTAEDVGLITSSFLRGIHIHPIISVDVKNFCVNVTTKEEIRNKLFEKYNMNN